MPANMHIFHATGIYRHLWQIWQIQLTVIKYVPKITCISSLNNTP